jgi:ferredoxin
MSAATTISQDKPAQLGDEARAALALRTFMAEVGVTTALHMEACVRCGLCAEACHFYVTTGDAKYTPIHKLEPFRRAYLREASPLAPLVRALGLVKQPKLAELAQWLQQLR